MTGTHNKTASEADKGTKYLTGRVGYNVAFREVGFFRTPDETGPLVDFMQSLADDNGGSFTRVAITQRGTVSDAATRTASSD